MSAISMMPAFSAWTSSPVPGTRTTTEMSAVRTMSTSSWPTPTVSMMTRLLPAASSTSAASLVARARPPSWPRVAIERMKTSGSLACACMRSAVAEDGASGERARRDPRPPRRRSRRAARVSAVSLSTSVLLPAPGRAGDAHEIAAAGVRKDVADQRRGSRRLVFDQRDGAGDGASVAGRGRARPAERARHLRRPAVGGR